MNTILSLEMANKFENEIEYKGSVTTVIKKYGDKISGFIKSKINNSDDAQDILQDVWYQLSRLTNLEDINSMSGWLHSVSKNKITDFYRKKKPVSLEKYTDSEDENNISFKEILLMDTSNNPELGIFKELFWNEFQNALDDLPKKQRDVFIWNEIEDKTMREISEELNISIKTVISRKGYAVQYLRDKLEYLYKELID